MNRLERMSVMLLIGGALLLPFSPRLHAQDKEQSAPSADKQQDSGKKKNDGKKNLKKLEKELATPYKKWLEEEVPYIITD
jgi:hypothetical protein